MVLKHQQFILNQKLESGVRQGAKLNAAIE